MNDHSDTDDTGDGEGVWSPDIEQCFREALLLFPPCGRRKHILQEEGGGKMYGRNELIARHIRMRTGKIRTRKQVSSHIQVLARRKAKSEAPVNGGPTSSGSPTSSITGHVSANINMNLRIDPATNNNNQSNELQQHPAYDVWTDRPIVTQKIRLVEFSAFIEYRRNQLPSGNLQSLPSQTNSGLASLATAALAVDSGAVLVHSDGPMAKLDSCVIATQANGGQAAIAHIGSAPSTPTYLSQPQPLCHGQQSMSEIGPLTNTSLNGSGLQLQQPLINNQQHHQQLNQRNQQEATLNMILSNSPNPSNVGSIHLQPNLNHQQHQQQLLTTQGASSGFTRHSYVKIDYRMPNNRQTNKIEKIVLSQIQDKFPEIGGSEGIFQRGPPDAFYLVKFWADLDCDYEYNVDDQNSYFGFSCHFETVEPYKDITCSTKACSYGLQVVEKVEKIYCAFNSLNGRYSFEINRSPMCEFMIQFIKKLRQLPRASQMNSVLENFTVLQEITSESTSEVLLCLAYVFEVAPPGQNNGSQYHVYKLTKD